jgi:predicted RNA binding protein YcfA (HicA-like mRNA interferase family)
MKYCKAKEINVLVAKLVREGWYFRRGGRHGRLQPPDNTRTLTVPISPSDHRAYLNFRRDVRHLDSTSGL